MIRFSSADSIETIDVHTAQARAIVWGISFALNAEEGTPSNEILQGMLTSVITLLDIARTGVEQLSPDLVIAG